MPQTFSISFAGAEASEFSKYDQSVVSKVIWKHAQKKNLAWKKNAAAGKEQFIFDVLQGFEQAYTDRGNPEERNWLKPYTCLEKIFFDSNIQFLAPDGMIKTNPVSELIKPLLRSYEALDAIYQSEKRKEIGSIPLDIVKACVREYFLLVQKTVFFKGNSNLHNIQFRNSEYLCHLVIPEYTRNLIKSDDADCGYRVSYADAFCLQALLDTADRLEDCFVNIDENDATRKLRIYEECTMADMSFGRYIWLKGQSYRITMNRQSSRIVARPFYRKSSITSVKPLRLYEKIKAFISNSTKDNNSVKDTFTVSIIGHCECSDIRNSPAETEVCDLCTMLDGWLSEQKLPTHQTEMPHIEIRYLINKADWFDCEGISHQEHFNGTIGSVVWSVEPVDYEKKFAFTTESMRAVIDASDMVFLLEPSFLFFENFEIYKNDTLPYYCEQVQKNLENKGTIRWAYDEAEPSTAYGSMQYLSAQLNRIMASRSMDAGNICRVLNTQYVDDIIQKVKSEKKAKKCVYLFSSETTGLDMSGMAIYPLSRVEKYNQKKMTIFQFCNYPVPSLLEKHQSIKPEEPAFYQISLWSLLKYSSMRYALMEIVNLKIENNGFEWLKPYDYFRIYKSILINVTATPQRGGQFKINAALTMKECFAKYLHTRMMQANISENDGLHAAEKLYETLLGHYTLFVEKLFKDILFSWDPHELRNHRKNDSSDPSTGNICGIWEENMLMRSGFAMNMYSSAKNTHDLFFLYLYEEELSKWQKTDGLYSLVQKQPDVEVNPEKEKETLRKNWNSEPGNDTACAQSDFFMDKKLFMEIPERISRRGELDMLGMGMCLEANAKGVYNCNAKYKIDYRYDLVDALLDLCKWANREENDLYWRLNAWKNKLL